MATVFRKTIPTDQDFIGEGDDDIRDLKTAMELAFSYGHFVEDDEDVDYDATRDCQLKFGERIGEYAHSGDIEIDMSKGTIHVLELTNNATLSFGDPPDNGVDGPVMGFGFVLVVVQDATGGRTITWPSSGLRWTNDGMPILATAANEETHFSFYTIDGGVSWYGTMIGIYV